MRTNSRLACLLAPLATLALSSSPAHAQTPAPAETPVTVFTGVGPLPLRSLLEELFRKAEVPYVIGTGVEGTVNANLKALPLEKALGYLLQSATPELTYYKDKDGVYIVRVKEKLIPASTTPINITNQIPQASTTPTATPPMMIASGSGNGILNDPILNALDLQIININAEMAAMSTIYTDVKGSENALGLRALVGRMRVLQEARRNRLHDLNPAKPTKTTTPKPTLSKAATR